MATREPSRRLYGAVFFRQPRLAPLKPLAPLEPLEGFNPVWRQETPTCLGSGSQEDAQNT